MSHQRKLVRAALVQLIKTKVPQLGGRVETNRAEPHETSQLPAAVLYTRAEVAELLNDSPRIYNRTVRLGIEVYLRPTLTSSQLDDELDDLIEPLESAVMANPRLGGCAQDMRMAETEIEFDAETGSKLNGSARINIDVVYQTLFDEAEDGDLAEFVTAHADLDIPGGEPIDMGSDTTLPQT